MSYGKVHDAFWEDEKVETLSDRAALLALFLVSGPHRNAIGCFKLGMGAITDNPRFGGWGIEGVSKALLELIGIGFIVRDERTGWTFIRNAMKYDPIKGRLAAVHAARVALSVPANTDVYQALLLRLSPILEEILKGEDKVQGYPMRAGPKANASPIETPSEGPSNTLGKPIPSPSPLPTPLPTPQPAAREWHPRYAEVQSQCEAILQNPNCMVWARVNAWLLDGADPEREIYPVLRARKDRWQSGSLEFFDKAIRSAIDARGRSTPAGRPEVDTAARMQSAERDSWMGRIKTFASGGRWDLNNWGPYPWDPKTRVPEEYLREFAGDIETAKRRAA